MKFSPFIIPIVAIIMGCGIPIVAMVLDHIKRRKSMECLHRERMLALEKGLPVPPAPNELEEKQPETKPSSPLLKGLVWFFVGLGMVIAFRTIDDDAAMLGFIPMCIGLAYLIYHGLEGRKLLQLEAQKPETKALD